MPYRRFRSRVLRRHFFPEICCRYALRARPILKLLARLLPELYSTRSNYYYLLISILHNGLHQALFSRKTTQNSDSGPASTTSSTRELNFIFFPPPELAVAFFYVYIVYLVSLIYILPHLISLTSIEMNGPSNLLLEDETH